MTYNITYPERMAAGVSNLDELSTTAAASMIVFYFFCVVRLSKQKYNRYINIIYCIQFHNSTHVYRVQYKVHSIKNNLTVKSYHIP